MKKEDAEFTPIYEVIADYPYSPFEVGEKLTLIFKCGYWRYEWAEDYGIEHEPESTFLEFPHLFKNISK